MTEQEKTDLIETLKSVYKDIAFLREYIDRVVRSMDADLGRLDGTVREYVDKVTESMKNDIDSLKSVRDEDLKYLTEDVDALCSRFEITKEDISNQE